MGRIPSELLKSPSTDEGELIEDYQARIGQWQDERSLAVYSALDAGPMVETSEEARLSALEIEMKDLNARITRLGDTLNRLAGLTGYSFIHAQW